MAMIGTNMKKFLLFLIAPVLLISCAEKQHPYDNVLRSFSELKAHFADPPAHFRTAPFWVWHDDVTREKIDHDLQDYKDKGIGGVFIHPRYGLITEYLSDEWFDLVEYAVERGRELGLYMWLYDENSFPSGFAGGLVPAEMPESYNQGAGLEPHFLSILADIKKDEFYIILKKSGESFESVEDISTAEPGEYVAFKKVYYDRRKWYAGYSYVDLLLPGVTEKFIDVTMKGYEKSVGKHFGDLVPGIFTDEPNIATPRGRHVLRWTPDLFEQFEKRWGYSLVPHLPSLLDEVGNWKKVRHDYYGILLELFIERWSKPWHDYTEKHNLKWTGHYWEHGWPNPYHGGDNMAMYPYHQVPAIDMLFNTLEERPDQFGNARAVKELSSIANQFGRVRTLSETYGAAGWELTYADMKRLGDWEYVLGVNLMNQHLTYMTLKGDRKHDFPQSFSYHNPWWEDYKVLADYYGRLSMALSAGKQINKTLVLEPTTTAWMYYSPKKSNARLQEIGHEFNTFVKNLEAYHVEYDLGSENTIKDFGSVQNGEFIIGQRGYTSVILPPGFESADSATVVLLREFLDNGGKVFSFVHQPLKMEGRAAEKSAALASSNNWYEVDDINATLQNWPNRLDLVPDNRKIDQLFHMRRHLYDGQLLFFTNFSLQENVRAECRLQGGSVIKLDPLTGEITPFTYNVSGDQVAFEVRLDPAASLLLFVSPEQGESAPAQEENWLAVPATTPLAIEQDNPNVLTLDYCDLVVGDKQENGLYFFAAHNKIWQAHGYPDNPWKSSSQFKRELVEADTFSVDSGFDALFPFLIKEEIDYSSLKLVVERPEIFKVKVNGNAVKPLEGEWWLDREFGLYSIGEFVKQGRNEITVTCRPMSIYAELEPVYILGDFSLESQGSGWALTKPSPLELGPWNEQGRPFYSHQVSYSAKYNLQSGKQTKVRLNQWEGTVASVIVNGSKAGVIGWPPYEADISKYVTDGSNEIEVRVVGSLRNLLGPHHGNPRYGLVTPRSFENAPEQQPAGVDYNSLPYGLFENFVLLTSGVE